MSMAMLTVYSNGRTDSGSEVRRGKLVTPIAVLEISCLTSEDVRMQS